MTWLSCCRQSSAVFTLFQGWQIFMQVTASSGQSLGYKRYIEFEPQHDKTIKMSVHPAKHPPSLIRVFAVRSVGS